MGRRQLTRGATIAAAMLVAAASAGAASTDRATVELDREGLAAKDNVNIGAVPDTTAAIGRRHYLEAVNARIAMYDPRTLKLVRARDHYAFWERAPRSGVIEDPQVVWDDGARRWYYAALSTGASGNRVLLAWTKSGDPANLGRSWCRMSIRSGTFIDDFPHLGFSRNHIMIAVNRFTLDHHFVTSRILAIGKPSAGRNPCARPPVTAFGSKAKPLHRADGRIAFTLIPVNPLRGGDAGYVVAADCVFDPDPGTEDTCGTRNRQANQLTLWHVDGPRGSPRLTRDGGIDVPLYRIPRPAPQRGAKTKLDASDTRLYQAVSAPDSAPDVEEAIWTQHTVAGHGGRSEVRWYELDPRDLTIVRRGTIRDAHNWVFSAAISPTARGDVAVIHYNVSGPGMAPQLRVRARGPDTPAREMTDEVTIARSSSSTHFCEKMPKEACGWGDYAAATPDPRGTELVWGSNELVGTAKGPVGTRWRTRNFAVRFR
jgi:hypothetical protein